MSEWIEHDFKWGCPVENDEQTVEVKWCDGAITKGRAGAFNWDMVSAYRVLPLPVHARP